MEQILILVLLGLLTTPSPGAPAMTLVAHLTPQPYSMSISTDLNASLTSSPTVNFHFHNMRNVSDTVTRSADLVFKQNIQRYAYGYFMLALCMAGVFGNLLAFTVLSTKSMRSSNTATYLRCLAVVDACVLFLAVFRYRSYYVLLSEREVIHSMLTFDRYAQVYLVPFFWIFLGVSSYITLCLSLERYLVVRWPFSLKKTYWVNIVRACTALAILTVCVLTFPVFLCYRTHTTSFHGLQVVAVIVSDRYLDARAYLHTYSHYLMPVGWYMGPWVLIAAVNFFLSLQVQKSSRIRVAVPNHSLNPNRNLTLLIILIVGVYMVCHFPKCILTLYCLVNHCVTNNDGVDVNTKSYYTVTAIADILNILNSGLNIIVYCFTGTKFRREVKRLILCRSCRKNVVSAPTHQSVHVSLREVPATPINTRKSFNVSFKELQLANSSLLRTPHGSQEEERLHPMALSVSSLCPSPSNSTALASSPPPPYSPSGFPHDPTDGSSVEKQLVVPQGRLTPIFTTATSSNAAPKSM